MMQYDRMLLNELRDAAALALGHYRAARSANLRAEIAQLHSDLCDLITERMAIENAKCFSVD